MAKAMMICKKNMLTCPSGKVTLQTFNKIGSDKEECPVNKLRNNALSVVRTSHFMYLDIDFWLRDNLYRPIKPARALFVNFFLIWRSRTC